ncbi:MAG: pyruvate kinase [bacterium]|jgi:pyruvate kinase|nr:pyruvate kinase [bacterium]
MKPIYKRTKILATIGPASDSAEMIEKLIETGINGARLNFSHGSYEEHAEKIKKIREITSRTGREVAILQDLQGPKIRLGDIVDNRLDVVEGDELVLDYAIEQHDGSYNLPVQYNLAEKVKVGEPVFIFDGKVRTEVIEVMSNTAIKLRVLNKGTLASRKGLNLPDTDFGGDVITEKDMRDIEFGATQDIDYVAMSFVQTAEDIETVRQLLAAHNSSAQVIAKIETKKAVSDEELEKIVLASDGVMIARGDMAYEVAPEVVPIVQRKVIALCRKHGKISIVATQTMGSMVDNPQPSRAEVSDVANAVIQGADVVMLSDETATGKYPYETVSAMRDVIRYTQEHAAVAPIDDIVERGDDESLNAISLAAVELAEQIEADALIVETKSGQTAATIAANRPALPIFAATSDKRVAQQLALNYATRSFVRPDGEFAGLELAKDLKNQGFFGENSNPTVVIVSGRQPGLVGGTDTIRVRNI